MAQSDKGYDTMGKTLASVINSHHHVANPWCRIYMSGSNVEHLFIIEDSQGRRAIPLENASYTIGRDRTCDIHLASLFVSRYHALLRRQAQSSNTTTYLIVDGDPDGNPSVNGLMINGQKITQHRLKHGDHVVFGPQVWATYQSRLTDTKLVSETSEYNTNDDPFDITLIDPAMMSGDTEEAV